jgi:hypothetical protein
MARTIEEIYTLIVQDKDAQTSIQTLAPTADTEQQLLSDLNSTSKVAIWRLMAYVMAVATHTHELLWDFFKTEVQAVADKAIIGTSRWYQDTVFKYQHGDSLIYDPNTGAYQYATENTALQIVKRCAIIEQPDGVLNITVAKITAGLPAPLSNAEQVGLAAFVKKVRFAGTRFTLLSGNGDVLRVQATIYYDGVVPDANITNDVKEAINTHIGQLPFNGDFLLSSLTDAIQSVKGVIDVVLTAVQTKAIISDPYTSVVRLHVPQYGYYKIDTTSGNTLNDTLTFIAQ